MIRATIGESATAVVGGLLPLAFAIAFASCSGSPSGPSEQGGLRLTGSITRSVVPAGETATLTFRLENLGSTPVTLNFTDSCQLNLYVTDASGATVYPPGGHWVCATVLTSLTLAPGQTERRDLKVGGYGQALDSYLPLGVGEYSAYVQVPSTTHKLQSDPVRFTVH